MTRRVTFGPQAVYPCGMIGVPQTGALTRLRHAPSGAQPSESFDPQTGPIEAPAAMRHEDANGPTVRWTVEPRRVEGMLLPLEGR